MSTMKTLFRFLDEKGQISEKYELNLTYLDTLLMVWDIQSYEDNYTNHDQIIELVMELFKEQPRLHRIC